MRKEAIICGFWLLLALYLGSESYRLGLNTGNRPGPGFFPLGAAAAIGLIAAFRLVKTLRGHSPEDALEPAGASESRLVLAVIAGMTAYIFLLDLLGFLLCTFLLIAFYLKVVAAQRWRASVIFPAAVALASHLFFDVLLNAHLPRGVLSWFH